MNKSRGVLLIRWCRDQFTNSGHQLDPLLLRFSECYKPKYKQIFLVVKPLEMTPSQTKWRTKDKNERGKNNVQKHQRDDGRKWGNTCRFWIAFAFEWMLGHRAVLINANEPLPSHSFVVVSVPVIGFLLLFYWSSYFQIVLPYTDSFIFPFMIFYILIYRLNFKLVRFI